MLFPNLSMMHSNRIVLISVQFIVLKTNVIIRSQTLFLKDLSWRELESHVITWSNMLFSTAICSCAGLLCHWAWPLFICVFCWISIGTWTRYLKYENIWGAYYFAAYAPARPQYSLIICYHISRIQSDVWYWRVAFM